MILRSRRQPIRPKYAFATSQGVTIEKQTIIVEFEHEGVVGLGEIAPSTTYGQTLESSEEVVACADELIGEDPFAIESIVAALIGAFDGQRAAIGGIESALYDWAGKRLGAPVYRLLGLPCPEVATTLTIGVADASEIAEKVEAAVRDGFKLLKVKVGTEHDERTLAIVRERFGGPLLLDANQAWSPDEAADRIRALAKFRPSMIEQPLARGQEAHLPALRELGVAPIFVDESCERPADVVRLRDAVDGINIKMTKCGGIREALRMIHLARAFEMHVMLGCFVASSLAVAPALAIASQVDFVDLDAGLLLAWDPFDGIEYADGRIRLTDAPGLGVRPSATR